MSGLESKLGLALEGLLEAWDYNGGGDRWCREVYGDAVEQARHAVELFKQEGSRCPNFSSAPPPDTLVPCIFE